MEGESQDDLWQIAFTVSGIFQVRKVYGVGSRGPRTRLFSDGEVERGRDGGTISIDRCNFQLIV